MTECPFIPSNADRLVQPHRLTPLVRSDQRSRAKGAKRLHSALKPGQILWRNPEAAAINPHPNASVAAKDAAHSALSPQLAAQPPRLPP